MNQEDDLDDILWELPFPVSIDSVADVSGTWVYQVTEQVIGSGGAYEVASPALKGPARELNNFHLTSFPVYAMATFRGVVDGQPLYEFEVSGALAGGGGTGGAFTAAEVDGAP